MYDILFWFSFSPFVRILCRVVQESQYFEDHAERGR